MTVVSDLFADEIYLAGQEVASGTYREISTGREINLEWQGVLPASLDGRVAAYVCVRYTWSQRQDPLAAARRRA